MGLSRYISTPDGNSAPLDGCSIVEVDTDTLESRSPEDAILSHSQGQEVEGVSTVCTFAEETTTESSDDDTETEQTGDELETS